MMLDALFWPFTPVILLAAVNGRSAAAPASQASTRQVRVGNYVHPMSGCLTPQRFQDIPKIRPLVGGGGVQAFFFTRPRHYRGLWLQPCYH